MMNAEWECSICYQTFGEEETSPRVLSCGHTFCKACLHQIINARKLCPYCQKRISAATVSDIPINYTVFQIVKSSTDRVEKKMPITTLNCVVHYKQPCTIWCYTCCIAICSLCALYTHQKAPEGSCELDSIKTPKFSIKRIVIININKLINHIQVIEREYDKSAFEILDDPNNERENIDKFRELNLNIQGWIKSLTRIKESLFAAKESYVEETIRQADIEINQIKRQIPKVWASYACHKKDGRWTWAKITTLEEGYLLHCLRDQKPPPGTPVMPYSEVRHLANNGDTSLAFLDIWSKEKFGGQVKVRVHGETPRATQFMTMCSGEQGPSYSDTKLWLEYSWFGWHKIRGGDYQSNDGSGGAAVIEGIDNNPSQYRTQWKKGVVAGRSSNNARRLAQFQIYLTDSSLFDIHHAFGDVVSGMEILENVLKTKNDDLYIKDCGLIIPPCEPTIAEEDTESGYLEMGAEGTGDVTARNNNAVTLLTLMFVGLGCIIQSIFVI